MSQRRAFASIENSTMLRGLVALLHGNTNVFHPACGRLGVCGAVARWLGASTQRAVRVLAAHFTCFLRVEKHAAVVF